MKSKFSLLGLFLAVLLTSPALLAAVQATATVSDNNVAVGDIFILTVSINDNDDDYQLDTRVLENDFTVYRPSKRQNTEYINGEFSQKTQWQLKLQSKQVGTFTIPSLKIGDYQTDSIVINAVKATQTKQQDDDQDSLVFIENNIDQTEAYIGQSVIYTTKLYIARQGNELDLVAPKLQGAEISVFGQDKNGQTVRNGIRFNTITRQYKISSTQAGQFEIDSPLLTGSLRKVVAVSEWQNKVIAEPINIRGESLSFSVKAIPDDYQGKWLVTNDLRLIEDNDLSAQSYKVGEPITRSITLQIASVDKDKLPNIKLNYPKSLRVYPDQDQLSQGQANGLSYGVRIIRHAIIANEAGTLTLPEIKINWFNSSTNQQQTTVLASQKLTILAADKQLVSTTPTTIATTKQTSPTIIIDDSRLVYWQLAVAILLIIIVLMVLYHLSYRRLSTNNKQTTKNKIMPKNQHYQSLQKSLATNNAAHCYSALLSYAQYQYPDLKSLNQLPDKTTLLATDKQKLKVQIIFLQQCCSDKSMQWSAATLKELLEKHESTNKSQTPQDPMDLNP